MEKVEELIRSGQLEQAEQLLEQKRTAGAAESRWQYLRGLLCEKSGDPQAAVDAYARAVELDEQNRLALFRLAYNLDLRGQDDEAIRLYEACRRCGPVHVNTLVNLAVLYEDRGAYEEAAACLRQVVATYPNHARAKLFLKDVESSMRMFYDEDQERTRLHRDAIMDTPVSDFELSVRSRNCLKKMNIHTLGDLLRISEAELLAYKNFGETSLNEIKAMLAQKGLRLGQAGEETKVTPQASGSDVARRQLPEISSDVINKPVSELELSVRSRKCLQRLNIVTLGELAMRTESELLGTKNFGQTSLNEIRERLAQSGLSLRTPQD